jgi:hypothetical protein
MSVERENIYLMLLRNRGPGFFVRRHSWSHPRTVARIVSVEGGLLTMSTRKPPYFANPLVWCELAIRGAIGRQLLPCPGTYGYHQVERPGWWPGSVGGSEATSVAVPPVSFQDVDWEAFFGRSQGTLGPP